MSKDQRLPKYKIGDLVRLNSSSVVMTVSSYAQGTKIEIKDDESFLGIYKCQWFAGRKLDQGVFPEESLVLVTDSEENLVKK